MNTTCPHCERESIVPDWVFAQPCSAGHLVRCGHCGEPFVIAQPQPESR